MRVSLKSIRAVYHQGEVFLASDNVSSVKEARELLTHEAYLHGGIDRLLGPKASQVLDNLYSELGLEGVEGLVAKYDVNLDPYIDGLPGGEIKSYQPTTK